ncbi:unnamed protein product, partial [Cochlearia groenlandica]
CFDVKSERFKFIEIDFILQNRYSYKLINYKGKLGVITKDYELKLSMWVMKDVEEPTWSENFSFCWDDGDEVIDKHKLDIVGVTAIYNIVMSTVASKSFYVYFLDPQRKSVRRVQIQGFRYNCFDNSVSRVVNTTIKKTYTHDTATE